MRYCYIKLHDFVQSYSPFPPSQEELKEFQQSLEIYLADIVDSKKSQESEEHQKNILRDFLNQSFHYDCNTKERIDLAIYEDSLPRVLFEVKKTSSNNQEFPKFEAQNTNLESKAFYESILYFLRENITHKNNNIEHIVLTNTEEFYLIDAKNYTLLTKEKAVIKAFENCEYKEGNDTSTKRFYEELSNLLPNLDMELQYTHFQLDDSVLTNIANCHSEASAEESHILPLLYQVLSPQVLLKRKTYLDANTLNQNFYDELLYILGLEENTQNSKVLIQPSQTNHTLLDSICLAFDLQRDKDFETIFTLLTTWNNRLLFLRLLESMLLGFKHIEKPFLDLDCLRDFQALNTLFFDILAKIEESRDANIPKALSSIPYLNSSLFEKTALEIEGKEIKLLESKPLMLYNDSILYKDKNFCNSLNLNAKTKDSTLPLLEYLFAFLHAYNFTTTAQDIKNHTKMNFDKLINSAVLGLVFEQLNGYKEGSFYTPSFITSYMCKQSLEKVVLQKFNSAKNWDCKDLESLKTKLDKLTDSKEGYKEANKIFDSIRICDPAVGSGHFLVSALNELVFLKFKLGILCDENFNRIKDISLELQNDEIVLRDSHNTLFAYTLPAHENIESHKIQKALFYNKRALIESCLFGVDINPNSCEITKLRLWIELLKYSYYKDIPNKRLETLPNIDINIKCGNSLISRFNLSDSLHTIPNINFQIQQYKKLVFDYKNADKAIIKVSKKDIEAQIETIKQVFTLTLKDPKTKKELEKAIESHIKQFNDYLLDDASLLDGLSHSFNIFGTPELSEEEREKALESYGKIQALRKKLDLALSGAEYKDAFEWRFAFPEVLDSNGDFLGFDLVIGNPPYIKELDNKKLFDGTRNLRTYQGKMDIWYHFVGLGFDIVKNQGIVTFIATNNWTTNTGAKNLRNVILTESQILNLVDFGSYMCFDAASIQTMVMEFQKRDSIPESYQIHYARIDSKRPTDKHRDTILAREEFEDNIYLTSTITPIQMLDKPLTFSDSKQAEVLNKILENGKIFLEEDEVAQGIVPAIDKAFILNNIGDFSKKEMKFIKTYYTGLQQKYCIEKTDKFLIYMSAKNYQQDNLNDLPNLKQHFEPYKEILQKAKIQYKTPNKPYFFLHREREERFFAEGNEKIISQVRCEVPTFAYTKENFYGSRALFFIQTNRFDMKFLTGLFNSKLIAFWLKYKGKMQGNLYKIEKEPLLNIPIPKITKQNQKIVDRIIALVNEILKLKAKDSAIDTSKLESEIDSLVYKLYNLTDKEIKTIENKEE